MKLQSLLLSSLFLFLTVSLSAQKRLTLDSNTVTKSYDYSDYDAIDVSGDFKVILNLSSNNDAITVEANSNLMDQVEVSKDGGTLRFKFKSNWNWNYKGKMILNVNISTRGMVNEYNLSGDAVMDVNNPINAEDVSINLKGDSILKANISANTLQLMAKSDSKVTLNGKVKTLEARLSSDSILKGKELTANDVDINLSGDSVAWVIATSSLHAEASGDSVLRYGGNPEVRRSKATGDSEIQHVN